MAEAQVDQAIELCEGVTLGQKTRNNAEVNQVAIGTWHLKEQATEGSARFVLLDLGFKAGSWALMLGFAP